MSDIDVVIRTLQTVLSPETLRSALVGALQVVRENAKQYPSTLPNQQYIRTYVLRDGWQYSEPQIHGQSISGDVYNDVPYAPDVMGAGTQEPFFAGRWRDTDMIASEMEPIVIDIIEATLQRQVSI
jgi:hypothetical protein